MMKATSSQNYQESWIQYNFKARFLRFLRQNDEMTRIKNLKFGTKKFFKPQCAEFLLVAVNLLCPSCFDGYVIVATEKFPSLWERWSSKKGRIVQSVKSVFSSHSLSSIELLKMLFFLSFSRLLTDDSLDTLESQKLILFVRWSIVDNNKGPLDKRKCIFTIADDDADDNLPNFYW